MYKFAFVKGCNKIQEKFDRKINLLNTKNK